MRRTLILVLCVTLMVLCSGCSGGGSTDTLTLTGTAGVGSVTLNWNSETWCWVYQGTTSSEQYRIDVGGTRSFKSSVTVTGLVSGQVYWFKVQKLETAGGSPTNTMSNLISVRVL